VARAARSRPPSIAEQTDRADSVVVGGDDEVQLVRIDVRIARSDHRDLELVRLGHRDPFSVRVDDEHCARDPLHLADAPERPGELVQLLGQLGRLLLREALEVAGLLAGLELVEQPDPLLDRDEVREHPAEPALVDVRHAGPRRLLGDRFLGLLLRPDEQDHLAAGDGLADGVEREVQPLDGLGEIDDVDPVALRENERAHLGIPAARLMAEMDPGLEQLPHRNGRHGVRPPVRFVPPRASSPGAGHDGVPSHDRHRPGRNGPRVSSIAVARWARKSPRRSAARGV
jgi:hypothetical protein